MARRKRGGDAVSLDSLLDTMANVVGILVLLLVVVQVSVGGALERIMGDVERPTAAQLEAAEADWLLASDELEEREAEWQSLGAPALGDDDEEKLARARAKLDEVELALAAAQGELTRVEVALDRAGDQPFESERVVRLPDPRPPPRGAEEINFFCRYERINHASLPRLFSALDSGWRESIGANSWDQNIPRSEFGRVIDFFRQRKVGDGPYRWMVRPDRRGARIEAVLQWDDPGAGLTAKDLRDEHSSFAIRLQSLRKDSHYLRFYVWGDSFEVYLAARRIAEDAGFAVGWRVFPTEMDPVVGPSQEGSNRID